MNLFFRYLATTTPEDVERLRSGGLTPRETETLQTLLGLRAEEAPSKEKARSLLGMSSSMFDKTCSLLLKKAYEQIVPEGGLPLLIDLLRRGLLQHFEYELRRGEREINPDDVEGLRNHYLSILQALQANHYAVEADRVAQYIRRQIRNLPLSPEDRLRLSSETLIFEVFSLAVGIASEEKRSALLRLLESMKGEITQSTDIETQVRIYDALATYYTHIEPDPEEQKGLLEKILTLLKRQGEEKNRKRMFITRFKLAENEHLFGSLGRAWQMYNDLLKENPDDFLSIPYVVDKYVQTALGQGEFAEAETVLSRVYGDGSGVSEPNLRISVAINYTKLYMLTDRLSQASEELNLIATLNQKDAYITTENELRLLQSILYMLRGDYAAVENLAPANLKYFRSKGLALRSGSEEPWIIKLLLLFIEQRTSGSSLPAKAIEMLGSLENGAGVVYGQLLRRAAASVGVALPAMGESSPQFA